MFAVDWLSELAKRDLEGLITPMMQAVVAEKALDAQARVSELYPTAYKLMPLLPMSERTLISIICEALFAILRNVVNEGLIRESDGVYSYTVASGFQAATIEFRPQDLRILESYGDQNMYYGSLQRGGI